MPSDTLVDATPRDATLPLEGQGGHLKRGLRRSFDDWDTLCKEMDLKDALQENKRLKEENDKLKVSETVLQDHVAYLTARLNVEVSKKRGRATEQSQGSPQLKRHASSASEASDINPFGLVTADGLTTLFGRNSRRSESSEPINWQLMDTPLFEAVPVSPGSEEEKLPNNGLA